MAIISKADVHLIVAIFLGALISVQAWDVRDRGIFQDTFGVTPTGTEDLSALAPQLLETWAIPFEVLSVVLLVGLVGAIAIAIKDDRLGGEP